MSKATEEMVARAKAEGIEEGKNAMARKIAFNLHDDGMAAEKISQMIDVSLAAVQEWLSEREVSP